MTITLHEADCGTFLLVAGSGRTRLVQLDWDLPALAATFGWTPCPLRHHGRHDRLRTPNGPGNDRRGPRLSPCPRWRYHRRSWVLLRLRPGPCVTAGALFTCHQPTTPSAPCSLPDAHNTIACYCSLYVHSAEAICQVLSQINLTTCGFCPIILVWEPAHCPSLATLLLPSANEPNMAGSGCGDLRISAIFRLPQSPNRSRG